MRVSYHRSGRLAYLATDFGLCVYALPSLSNVLFRCARKKLHRVACWKGVIQEYRKQGVNAEMVSRLSMGSHLARIFGAGLRNAKRRAKS